MQRRGLVRRALKSVLGVTLKPFLQHFYLKRRRRVRFGRLALQVDPGVFHPGLFFSSRYMSRYLQQLPLAGKRLLDVGCGSGLISLVAAAQGARVSSVDINEQAVANTRRNAQHNQLSVDARVSDLFEGVGGEHFDLIVVNPPYYPKTPVTAADHAWFCGEDFEYFVALFAAAPGHMSAGARLYMVLSDDCDIQRIKTIATDCGFDGRIVDTRGYLIEHNFILAFDARKSCQEASGK